MSSRTPTQQDIIKYAKKHPEATGNEIAETVGCSVSYANKVRRENLNTIIGKNDLSPYTIDISLAHPYKLLLSDECISQLDLFDEEIVEIDIIRNGETVTVRAPIEHIEKSNKKSELHSYTYGLSKVAPDIPNGVRVELSDFLGDNSDDDISIFTPDAFDEYLSRIDSTVNNKVDEADIMVGIGLASLGIEPTEEESEVIQLPNYQSNTTEFRAIFSEEHPRLVDLKKYEGEVTSPETVIFSVSGDISEKGKEDIKEHLQEIKFFDLSIGYFPSGKYPINGPQTFEQNNGILDISESSIEIWGTKLVGQFFNSDPPEFDDIVNSIMSADIMVDINDKEYEITNEIFRDSQAVVLSINDFSITISYSEEALLIFYSSEMNSIDNFVEGIFDFLSDEFESESIGPSYFGEENNHRTDNWIFDTNAIYHQIIDDTASSILKTILPNFELYIENFIIPWPVLYEINKHKDDTDSGPPPAVQEIGLENLRTLKILDSYEFINLEVESIPEDIKTKVSESHVADLHVLQKAQSTNSILISGDGRLRRLAEISDTPVIDIHEYAVVEDIPDLSNEVWDEINPQIGKEISKRDDILAAIEKEESEAVERHFQNKRNVKQPDPETYLDQWTNDGKIIPVYCEDEEGDPSVRYEKAVSMDIVITPSVARELTDHIEECNNSPYLTEEVLDSLADVLNLPSPGLPLISFHVPLSNVLGPQSISMGGISTEARQFYQLKQLENAEYHVDEVNRRVATGEKVQSAVQLARNQQYTILCTDTDRYIDPIGNLLGVDVREYKLK